jgi:hypothetical protein
VKVAGEEELATRLAEQLLADPALRAEFRRDPVAAARRAGLAGLAEELSAVGGAPRHSRADTRGSTALTRRVAHPRAGRRTFFTTTA